MFTGLLRFVGGLAVGAAITAVSCSGQTVGVLREVWEGIGGVAVSDLTGSADYPAHPTSSNYVTDLFEAPTDVLENYGQRLHGYVVPPLTGAYTFWIASDDGGALYLSTDEDPAHVSLIASVNGWTSSREWEKEPNQRSAPVSLVAGRAYYISALMKEGGGGDNLAVRWLMPNGVDQAPMVATNLLPWGVSFAPPTLAQQPANTTAVEGGVASFSVRLSAVGPATYQWRKNGVVLPGSDSPVLSYGPVRLADQGARFSVVVTNQKGSAESAEAVLTVTPDVTAPTVVGLLNIGTGLLRVTFSEPVAPASATNRANYVLTPALTVRSARLGGSPDVVELSLDPLTYGSSYAVRVSNVQDQAQAPNAVPAGAGGTFIALEYSPATVGQPPLAGGVAMVSGGLDVTGSGDIGGKGEACEFAYQPVTGNFDRRVRLSGFSPTDPFAKAGWMARATLDTNSAFAAVLTTPAQLGTFFLSRASAGADAVRVGAYPPNFPDAWFRLARSGNTFRGFASLDGQAWTELGSASVTMPATILLGLAVGSRSDARAAVVQFRDFGDVTGATTASAPARRGETLGPSSRATALVISEIMYHPRERTDGRRTEFVEIYNGDLIDQDLGGTRLSGAVDYTFPEGYRLPAGGFAVVARVPADVSSVYGLAGVLGPFESTNNLPNSGGLVRLRNRAGAVLLEARYDTRMPWPIAVDGAGHSLVLARPSYGEDDPRAWAASEVVGGSPGRAESLRPNPQGTVLLNELLAHTDPPQLDAVELYNHGNEAVDIGGCVITDDARTNRFRIPTGTVLTPRGYLSFDELQLGFRLNAAGETLFLFSSDGSRVLDAVRYGAQENGVSFGRYPDGSPDWRRLQTVTLGAENTPDRVSAVVINEILYHPITGDDGDQFVELYNRTAQPVDLSGWSFTDGIDYRFPAGTVMPAGAYFVVARSRDQLLARNPGLMPGVVFGDFGGRLSGSGERLALAVPDWLVVTNQFGMTETNRIDIEVDDVTYGTGGRWGQWSDGLGSSLELVDANSDHRRPSNWADSDESTKAPWTTVEFTGRVDNVADGVSTDRIHLVAQGPGEYLVDDVEVLTPGGANRVANGDFANGITGWTAQGNHRASAVVESGGVGGGRALKVSATSRGDTAVNRVRANLSPTVPANSTLTLRAKVRWLKGWPEFLLRTHGSGIEAPGRLELPAGFGTPGARNSRAVDNAGPAIFDVRHAPVTPRANEVVLVTARVSDPDGIQSVNLRYRLDPATTLSTVAMRDDGSGGDGVAGDGVFTASLPGRAAGVLVAFRIEAVDRRSTPATAVFPAEAPQKELLVHWGDQKEFGNVGTYRFWQRQSDYNRLRSREPLANDNLDCTFVYGDERVIYNAGMRGKGSPWHGGSVGADYLFALPEDDPLLGATDMAICTLGNLGSDLSAQREQAAFWIGDQLGVAALHRRHIRFYENSDFKGPYEDTEEPNGQFVDRRFPDGPNGDLFKIEDWFEFDDSGSSFIFNRDATLQRFTTLNNALKLARYRWAWRKRAVNGSANDYDDFFRLVQAINGSGVNFVPQLEALADIEAWMRTFALQHIVGNWDAYGYGRGKNSYLYLPKGGRWQIVPWDIDFVLGSGGDGPTTDVFGSVDPRISVLWDTPAFRRMYWRAFQEAINGPLREEAFLPVIRGRYDALVANGFNVESYTGTRNYINQRRQYLEGRVRSEDAAALTITSNGGADFATNRNLVTISGVAPVAVRTLIVNGVAFPVTWNTVTTWSVSVPLGASTNVLVFEGLDRRGQLVPGLRDTVTVRYTGTPPRPEDFIVINEIMYDAPAPGAGFVELYNSSPTGSFDLSGWRLEGADYVFPAGTILRGGAYLVVAADLEGFRSAYGTSVIPVGVFQGTLQNNGERIRLVRPGATPELDTVVSQVRYDNELPWPVTAQGQGPSLQLLDPRQDTRRVANWGASPTNGTPLATPGAANSVLTSLEPFPALWLNEVLPANSTGLADRLGHRGPWVELFNSGDSTVDLSGLSLAASFTNLLQWPFPAGTSLGPKQFLVVWCDGAPGESSPTELHASFRLAPTNGSIALVRLQAGLPAVLDYLEYRALPADKAWGSYPDGDPTSRQLFHLPTPGAANRPGAPSVQVLINEWMADNRGSVPDPADGDPDDWFELYNAGSAPADLSAYTLSDEPARPDKARIPNGTVLPPGGFLLVWADEELGQTTNGQLHVSFKLSATGESIGLYAPDGARVDAVTFGAQSNNVAQGRFPDGGPEPFLFLDFPTPAAANVVGTANQPPALRPLVGSTVDEGAVATFTAVATDPDSAQHLRFSLLGAPAAATIDPVAGVFRWATGEADGPGSYTFSVRVTDDGQPPRSDTKPVTLVVREVNQPPLVDPVADQAVDEGSELSFVVAFSDPDLPAQKLTVTLDPGAPEGAVVDPVSGRFTWRPVESQGPGVYPVTVRVTDDGAPAASATRRFNVTVREVDNAPEFDLVGLQTIEEGTPFSLRLVARDPDAPAQALTYSLDTAPSGAVIDPVSGVLTWTPSESAGPGSYNVVAKATQAGGGPAGTLQFSIVVNERNEAPELATIDDRTVDEGALVAFSAVATDSDLPPQRLTFSLDPGAPSGASVDAQTGVFTWPVPPDAGASTNLVTLRVTDNAIAARSAARTFTVVVRAVPRLVINEIQYAPKVARTEFIEIANLSSTTAWNLGGWQLTGLDFTFPTGTVVGPTNHLVVARDLTAFRAAYGGVATAVGNGTSAFTADGPQFVRLRRPVSGGWQTVSEVSFLRAAPWPTAANGTGASLQLIDPSQDVRRVANWAALAGATTNAPRNVVAFTNVWRYKQDGAAPAAWREPGFNDATWPAGPGLLYVEEAALPGPKNTALVRTDGRLTYYFRTHFTFAGNPDGASLVLNTIVDDGFVLYLNGREIYRLGLDPAATVTDTTTASRTVADAVLEGPFTIPVTNLVAGDNTLAVEVHQTSGSSSDVVWGANIDVLEIKREPATPGYANSVRASLPPFPSVWINEVLPRNTAGLTDNAGDRDPWIELHNAGDVAVDLAGWFLTDDLASLRKWSLPNPAPIAPHGYRLVWADGEPGEQTTEAWHTSFRPAFPKGLVALVRDQGGIGVVVDYLNYEVVGADEAFGSVADADPLIRGRLAVPSPGAPNVPPSANRPPVIDPVGDRTAMVGQALVLTIHASDPDLGQRLSYELLTAPGGATLDTETGRLTWTPSTGQEGNRAFVVRVADNGSPSLDARVSFSIVVSAAPAVEIRITGVQLTGAGEVRLTWTTAAGKHYAVQAAPGLGGNFTQLGAAVLASGPTLSVTFTIPAESSPRFFRITQTD